MENIIQKHRAFVAGQIEKSFNDEFQVPNQEVEKAYNVGDEKDFNGRTYYVHGIGKTGMPLWRLKDKKTKSDNEKKFKENFKDASDDVLQKIVEGKIQAGDQEKKWATDIINERKKSVKSEAAAKKIIDLLTTSSSKYTDIKKVVAFKTDKGNWAIDYDGANTGVILNGSKLSEAELKRAGVKIEGANANSKKDSNLINDIKSNEDAFIEACGLSNIKRVVSIRETPTSVFIKYENNSGQEQEFPLTKNVANSVLKEVKAKKSKKADPRDKVAQNAGFKDYVEMKGFQEYVTAKSLLKKPSMQAKTKQAEREALEKQVADYEKDHADVIAARSGKKSIEKKADKKSDDWNDNLSGYKTKPFEGAVKVADLKVGDKLISQSGKTMTVIGVNKTKDGIDIGVKLDKPTIGDGTHWGAFNKNSYYGAKIADKKDDKVKK